MYKLSFIKGTTGVVVNNIYDHDYYVTTLIENPTNVLEDRKY